MLAYTGSIAFIVNKQLVKDIPASWADLKQGTYKVSIGDVSAAAQAVNGVLAAAIALGAPVRWSLVRGDIRGFDANEWGVHPLFPLSQPPN